LLVQVLLAHVPNVAQACLALRGGIVILLVHVQSLDLVVVVLVDGKVEQVVDM
jgi:hypothetical protein